MRTSLVGIIAVLVVAGVTGWLLLRPRPSDEQRIYRMIADAAQAVEKRNPSGILRFISEDYQDPSGNTKHALTQQIVGGLRATEKVIVVPEIAELNVTGDTATSLVKARIWFGEAGQGHGTDLRIRLQLVRESHMWRVISADGWSPAVDAYMND